MLKGHEARQISELLRLGFIVDEALLALEGIDPLQPSVGNVETLRDVREFLRLVNVSFSRKQDALAGSQTAARAVIDLNWDTIVAGQPIADEGPFVEWIAKLDAIAGNLESTKPVETTDLDTLREFLEIVGHLSMTQVQALRQKSEGAKDEPWPMNVSR